MRILHLNPFFYPYRGGTENYLLELCKRLSKRNSVSAITSNLPGTDKFEEIEGTRVYRINSVVLHELPASLPPPLSIPLSFRSNFYEICKREKPDIIHIHNRFFFGFSTSVFLRGLLRVPFFLTLHNARAVGISENLDFLGQLFDDIIGKVMMSRCDRIIGNSKWTLDVTLPKSYPRERTEVIYNGVDTKKFKKIKTDLKDRLGCEFLSTTVCRLITQKGVKYLINAVKEIEGDFKAVIIGRGPKLKELISLTKKFGLEKKVEFVSGLVSEEDVIRYYSASDFFILPSLWEPFGIVLIEAMACGNPVVATNVGGIPEVVSPRCGLLVEPRSAKHIADAANKLINDENLRRKLARNARERTEKVFDFDNIAKKVELSYRDYLEGINKA